MHVIKDGNTLYLTNIENVDDIEKIKVLYKKLLNKDVSITKSKYPVSFLKNHPCGKTTSRDLHKAFKTWMYNEAKVYKDTICSPFLRLGRAYKDMYTTTVNNIRLVYYLPKLLERMYLHTYIYIYASKKKEEDHIVALEEHEEEVVDTQDGTTNVPDMSLEEDTTDGLQLPLEPPPHFNISQILDNVMDGFSSDTSYMNIGNAPTKTQEGYTCFTSKKNKWPTYYASVSGIIKSIPINNLNNLPTQYYMFIRFKDAEDNTSFVFLDHTYMDMLQKLDSYGITGIIIEDVVFYPYIDHIDTFVKLLKVPGVSYIHDVYKIRKFIGNEKPLKSVELKNILEFLYNTYVFDFNSNSNFLDLYVNYKNTANCYNKVCEKDLYNALVYFGFMYKDGEVQYLKKRDKRISTYKFPVSKTLQLDLYSWNHKIVQRNHQLRQDPPISMIVPLHNVPWYVTSAFD
jgi:hypothetical protein